jgi:hypothetical protein
MHLNKVAIFIRGYKRTWDWVKHNNFKIYEELYGNNIDWYVATWKTNTTTYESVLKDFAGKNLKSLHVVDETNYPMPLETRGHMQDDFFHTWTHKIDSYWRLAYLDLLLSHDKIKNEACSELTYDVVLFTRFDLYCLYSGDQLKEKYLKPKLFTISSDTAREDNHDFSIIDDYQYKTDSVTADIIAFRFFDTHINDYANQATPLVPETMFSNYLFRNNITYDKSNTLGFKLFLIRPNHCNTSTTITKSFLKSSKFDSNWNSTTMDYRHYHCKRIGIDASEYIFNIHK